jgi:hypothetical protein
MSIKYHYNFIFNLKNNFNTNDSKLLLLKQHEVPLIQINKKQKQLNLKYQSNRWRYNDKDDIFKKKLNGILNKISQNNYDELKNMIENIGHSITIENFQDMDYFAERIINKALNDNFYIGVYGKLLKDICKYKWYCKNKLNDNSVYISFYDILIQKIQNFYEEIYDGKNTNKQNCISIIQLLSHIYLNKLLSTNIFLSCLYGLLENPSELNIELICKMIRITNFNNVPEKFVNDIMNKIKIIHKTITNSRIKYLLLDIIELADNQWNNKDTQIIIDNDIEEKLNNIIDEYVLNENIDDIIYIINDYNLNDSNKLIEMIIKYCFNLNKEKIISLLQLSQEIIKIKKVNINKVLETILLELDDILIDFPKANDIIVYCIQFYKKNNLVNNVELQKFIVKQKIAISIVDDNHKQKQRNSKKFDK